MTHYYRAIPQTDTARPPGAVTLAQGWCWFTHAEVLSRDTPPRIIAAGDLPDDILTCLTRPRGAVVGLSLDRPRIMGILNVTPDSFSDGGRFAGPEKAVEHALAMQADGADLIDIGGESTRPGAGLVPAGVEAERTAPVIAALRARSDIAVSIDTRKAQVARAAIAAGAGLVNDVSAMVWDNDMAQTVAGSQVAVCLMHALGVPATMQENPDYDDVLLDVYDHLSERISVAQQAGIARDRIIVDPGIGFGKTQSHNFALLRRLSLFHSLGCGVLLGASRKRFIGTITGAEVAAQRWAGSVAVTLAGLSQGVQLHRVHDTKDTKSACAMMRAINEG